MSDYCWSEKENQEKKNMSGKFKVDRGDALGWAAVFFWGALVLIAELTSYAGRFAWWDGWALFFAGVGTIILTSIVIQKVILKWKVKGITGWLICGFMLLGFSLAGLMNWNYIWPLFLIAIAATILVSVFRRQS